MYIYIYIYIVNIYVYIYSCYQSTNNFSCTLNNFIFNSKLYLQIKGCAMGTICAPAYANIFMAYFEEKFIYLLIDAKTMLYLRFTDDIFMIWTKSEKDLIEFLNELNTKNTSINFEFKYSRQ